MKTYLFAWNPRHWAWNELPHWTEKVARGEPVADRWRCTSYRQVKKGDRAFLVRQGAEPRGLFGSGLVVSEPYQAEHWQLERAVSGEEAWYVDVRYDALLDPLHDVILTRQELSQPPLDGVNWDTPHSGVEIPPEIADDLERAWRETLSENGLYPIWPGAGEEHLKSAFLQILNAYLPAKDDPQQRAAVAQAFQGLRAHLAALPDVGSHAWRKVAHSMGVGKPARVPWLAVLDERASDAFPRGLFCAFLFKADMSGVYLTFSQDPRQAGRRYLTREDLERLSAGVAGLRARFEWLAHYGFQLDEGMQLGDGGPLGRAYQAATIAYKFYPWADLPADDGLIGDLQTLLRAYEQVAAASPRFGLRPEAQPAAGRALAERPTGGYRVDRACQPEYSLNQFAQETGYPREQIDRWALLLRRKQQLILQGPPGTGKTFVAERLARYLTGGTSGFWDLVQFHPAYSYEDFIQGLQPRPQDGAWQFELQPGAFLSFCRRAETEAGGAPCVLVIDEINRANLSRVFGELMYLLEYRQRAIPLAAGGEPFRIPANVYLVGTMNTADRSIALVDYALRRRFAFVRLQPEYGILQRALAARDLPAESLVEALRAVNAAIDDPNYELGISFFMAALDRLPAELPLIWRSEIEPYLEEYFYDQPGKLAPFRWDALAEGRLRAWRGDR